MIKETELRIGNLVGFYRPEVTEMRIGSVQQIYINEDNIYRVIIPKFSSYIGLPLAGIKPITLTEEWLISFGFIKESNKNIVWDFTDKKTGWFTISERDGFYKFCNIRDLIGKQFKYVHELQNLYFSLTGNDLIYNK
jgi:hypothetical protein